MNRFGGENGLKNEDYLAYVVIYKEAYLKLWWYFSSAIFIFCYILREKNKQIFEKINWIFKVAITFFIKTIIAHIFYHRVRWQKYSWVLISKIRKMT